VDQRHHVRQHGEAVRLAPQLRADPALLGLVIAAGVSLAASRLSSQHIGLSSEPLSAGQQLSPVQTTTTTTHHTTRTHTTRTAKPPKAVAPTTARSVTTTPQPTTDDHGGSGRGGGSDDHGSGGHGSDD
jgi:hypothetical protein